MIKKACRPLEVGVWAKAQSGSDERLNLASHVNLPFSLRMLIATPCRATLHRTQTMYIPVQDPLLDLLTAEEQLTMYARLKVSILTCISDMTSISCFPLQSACSEIE